MTRSDIEKMTWVASGWDAELPGPIEDTRWKMYRDENGMYYAILDKIEKYKFGNSGTGDVWTAWRDL